MPGIDLNKSLQDLDGEDWGDPDCQDTHLVHECYRLHCVPLRDFGVEDLRITIGQDIGLEYLVPLAIEKLVQDPFVEGAYYPCDLLVNVLGADSDFWRSHPQLRDQVITIADRAIAQFPALPEIASPVVVEAVSSAYAKFKRKQR